MQKSEIIVNTLDGTTIRTGLCYFYLDCDWLMPFWFHSGQFKIDAYRKGVVSIALKDAFIQSPQPLSSA